MVSKDTDGKWNDRTDVRSRSHKHDRIDSSKSNQDREKGTNDQMERSRHHYSESSDDEIQGKGDRSRGREKESKLSSTSKSGDKETRNGRRDRREMERNEEKDSRFTARNDEDNERQHDKQERRGRDKRVGGGEKNSRVSPNSRDNKRYHERESREDSSNSDEDRERERRSKEKQHQRHREERRLDRDAETSPSPDEDRERERRSKEKYHQKHREERRIDRDAERSSRHKEGSRHRRRHESSDDDRKHQKSVERVREDDRKHQKSVERVREHRGREIQNLEGDSNHKQDKKREEDRDENSHAREKPLEEMKKEADKIDMVANAGRSGGIYIPPYKLARMMKEVQDKSSVEYQRLTWDALRKSINGLVNKVNATNIKNIIPELFAENLIRGRGLFCRSCMKSQMASPGFTDVFAALVAVVNTKFPEVGNLLLRRIILQLKRAYKRNDKPQLLAATKFIAHLVNQQVAHEIISLELLTVLLENPTDDSVEVAVGFVKECGSLLQDLSPQGLHGIFERFRGILHEGEIDRRVQFLIEGLFAIRKAKFQNYPAVRPELDLVEQEDQFTHELSLEDEIDQEIGLDIFKPDPQFLEHEKAYEDLKKDILGDEPSSEEEGSSAASDSEDDEDSDDEEEENMKIKDETETNLVNLRRTIYLTIMSSVDFEEAGHKLLKIKLEPGQEMELCIMLLECCSQERTYLRYYGLLGQRFCMINKVHQENFETCFVNQYSMIHRLETNKLRNVAKFFAHLLGTDALPWHVLSYIRLTEEDTTSSSRIFIKILFQELSEHLGIRLLNERLNDPAMQDSFESIFPKDNPKNTRFSINFFTSIGLGGITESLREYLKNMPRLIMQQQKPVPESDDSGSSGTSSSGDSSSESESESEPSSDEGEEDKRHRKRRKRD
ncbi:pre-mRNA-splicing factor CWC22 [Cinnamomum micranthum f. kanehirae]|uniref:Pre-mRNA-splicing factor CWC22 n=1 Tax=Cinnamomum micranthum f. kanehirae TaxID=337451 RepID=A0A3S3PXC4_9MAGN|nr:pre-mRNA-splicing factor CWC22 [Cinnamomum micranthum f. kanehirae]